MECLKPDINVLVNWTAHIIWVYDLGSSHLSSQKLVLNYSLIFLLYNCSNEVLLILSLKFCIAKRVKECGNCWVWLVKLVKNINVCILWKNNHLLFSNLRIICLEIFFPMTKIRTFAKTSETKKKAININRAVYMVLWLNLCLQ